MRPADLFLSPHLSGRQVVEFLRRYGFEDPEQADRHLQRIADLVGVRERMVGLSVPLLEALARTADPDAALLHLGSLFEATPGPLNLLSYLHDSPSALEVLVGILGASPFLAQVLCRNPEYFYWLTEGDRLQQAREAAYFLHQADDLTRPFSTSETGLNALRRLRRRESLRIGAQDLLDLVDLPTSVQHISQLADAILQKTFDILAHEILPSRSGFTVLGLGKLGGTELNFSSDIDLLYVYGEESQRDLMLRFAREYTRRLVEYTDEGRLYRVDLRLRPMGKSGEIAYSLPACRQYYETWADTFDRLALLKCRWVAGDRLLGIKFIESIQDFVYKKYFDIAALEEIRWLKRRTDRQLRRRGGSHNIKLGLGGIREIEFFVQAFQLLYGGHHPQVRNPSTLGALDLLADQGFVSRQDHGVLRRAYLFFRRLEHKLQLVYDLQTHSLPKDRQELLRCARRMGYRDEDRVSQESELEAFLDQLREHERAVHHIFESLFEIEEKPADLQELVLNPELTPGEALKKLAAHGLHQPEEFHKGINLLKDSPSYPHSPTRLRNLVANLVPCLVRPAQMSGHPRRLFARLDRFCESLGARAALYAELIENSQFRERLLTIFASGDFLSEILIRSPELVDSISVLPVPELSLEELNLSAERERPAKGSLRNVLRLFKQREEFKVALYDLFCPEVIDSRRHLSDLAEVCLQWAVRQVFERLPDLNCGRFALLALGKLGGRELTYHSDLDLVLVYDESSTQASSQLFVDLLRELREELEQYTELGPAYKLDFRLRPEGKHTALAVPLEAFRRYFSCRAEAWERLAYVKMRPVVARGEPVDLAPAVWGRPFSPAELRELAHIRQRKETEIGGEKESGTYNFKVGRGGLMDVQFVTQYLQLKADLRETNTIRALDRLVAQNELDQASGTVLKEGWKFLTRLEMLQRLLEERSANAVSREPEENRVLALFLGFESGQSLLERYRAETGRIRDIYGRFFGN